MLLAIDGFDHYDAAEAQAKGWSIAFPSAMSPGRYGVTGKAANWTPYIATADNRYPLQTQSNDYPMTGFGWMFLGVAGETPVVSLADGGTSQVTLTWNGTDNKFRLRSGVGTTGAVLGTSAVQSIAANVFHHLDLAVQMAASAGAFSLKVNSESTPSMTGTGATQVSGNARMTHFVLPASTGVGGNVAMRYDDVYVADTQGGMIDLGDQRVYYAKPVTDAQSDFVASPTGTHFDKVNATALSGTSYVSSQTVGAKDTFGMTQVPATATITGVQVVVTGYKTDAGARAVAPVVTQGGTDTVGADIALASAPQVGKALLQNNPATSAVWTAAQLNSDSFGVEVTV